MIKFILPFLLCFSVHAQIVLKGSVLNGSILGTTNAVAAPPVGTPFVTSFSGGSTVNAFTGKVGMKFQPTTPITVTSLGRYVVSGNTLTHVVELWDTGTTGTDCNIIIASVTVDTSGQSANTVVYGNITPTALLTSHSYAVMSNEISGQDKYLDDNSTTTVTSDATLLFSLFYSGSCGVNSAGHTYGVNWKYTNP